MKRNILSVFLMLIFTLVCFSGCGQTPPEENKLTFYVDGVVYYTVKTDGYKVINIPNPSNKPGYSFEGWYYDNNEWEFPFSKFDFEKKPVNGSINIYAKYRQSRLSYNITFYNGTNVHATISTPGYETLTLPNDPTKNNCTFAGWYFDNETFLKPFMANSYASKKLGENISIYAKFIHNDGTIYKINFMVDDKVYHTIDTAGNKVLTNMPLSPDKPDYLFMGWYFDKNTWQNKFDANTYANTYLTDNITVYAYFKSPEPEVYTITFVSDGATVATVQTAGHETIALPENPTKSGYDFNGWYFDNETFLKPFEADYYESTNLTGNVTIYAKFTETPVVEPESHSIMFYSEGTLYSTIQTLGNETITLPTNPYSDTHTFGGWYFDNETFSQQLTAETYATSPLNEDVVVYSKFTPDVYNSNLEFTLSDDGTYYSVSGLGECENSPNILIPDTYNDLPVKVVKGSYLNEHGVKISDPVFYESTVIKLKISANIEKIERWAFGRCFELKKLEFAENSKLHTIEELAFNICKSLLSVNLPKGVTTLPQYAFAQCESLASFTFEDANTFTEFGPYALYGAAITEFDVPKNVTIIGEHCFAQCASLKEIYFHKALKTIDTGAFNDCRKLKYVEIEDTDAWCGVYIADPWAVPFNWADGFYQNGERVKKLVISEGVKKIGQFAFADCTLLEEITIPSTVELMESCAFADILRLKVLNYNAKNCKLNFHHSSSHYYIFEHCGAYSLTAMYPGYQYPEGAKHITLNIGATVETVPASLFGYASGAYAPLIKTLNFLGETPPVFSDGWFKGTAILETLTVPEGSEDAYKAALGSRFEGFFGSTEESA